MKACRVNCFESANVTDIDLTPNGITLLQLTKKSFVQYGSLHLGYQLIEQEMLYLPPFPYTFLYNQYIMQNAMNSLL
jgi:hypothetical protein